MRRASAVFGAPVALEDQPLSANRSEWPDGWNPLAPHGGVMLSASTARLVEGADLLGEPELVQIKGAEHSVPARRLLGMADGLRPVARAQSSLVGRRSEIAAVESLLDNATAGRGAVAGVVGSPGIGKSRLAREVMALARGHNVKVFTTFCESHATNVPFRGRAATAR